MFGLGFDYHSSAVLAAAKRAIAKHGEKAVFESPAGYVENREFSEMTNLASDGLVGKVHESYHTGVIPGTKPRHIKKIEAYNAEIPEELKNSESVSEPEVAADIADAEIGIAAKAATTGNATSGQAAPAEEQASATTTKTPAHSKAPSNPKHAKVATEPVISGFNAAISNLKPGPEELLDELLNSSYKDAANHYDVSETTLRRWASEYGIPTTHSKIKGEADDLRRKWNEEE